MNDRSQIRHETEGAVLELQPPHVHRWVLWNSGEEWLGPVDDVAPPIHCDVCTAVAGDWADVEFGVHVEAELSFKLKDMWPDGDWPMPASAQAIAKALEGMGRQGRVLREFMDDDDLDVTVTTFRPRGLNDETAHAVAWAPMWRR